MKGHEEKGWREDYVKTIHYLHSIMVLIYSEWNYHRTRIMMDLCIITVPNPPYTSLQNAHHHAVHIMIGHASSQSPHYQISHHHRSRITMKCISSQYPHDQETSIIKYPCHHNIRNLTEPLSQWLCKLHQHNIYIITRPTYHRSPIIIGFT